MLDVNLPNVHSLEACREITRVNPTTKVIMFTAMGDPAVSQAFFEAGALPSYQRRRLENCCRRSSDSGLTEADTPKDWSGKACCKS